MGIGWELMGISSSVIDHGRDISAAMEVSKSWYPLVN
jgi:hypothetical protein